MKFDIFSGFIFIAAVVLASAAMVFSGLGALLNLHAAIIVIGGTAAISLACFRFKDIWTLLKVFYRRMLGSSNRRNYLEIIDEIVLLSTAKSEGKLEQVAKDVQDPFLRDAVQALFWDESSVDSDELRDLLENRVNTHYETYMSEAGIFGTLAKIPPAMGLMGTTMGMIALFASLGGEDARNVIGPSMSVALMATLYGLILANCILFPISEHLSRQTKEDRLARSIVVEGIVLIRQKKSTLFVKEKLKSFLLPKDWAKDPDANESNKKKPPTRKAG